MSMKGEMSKGPVESSVPPHLSWALPRLLGANVLLLLVGHLGTCSSIHIDGYAPLDKLQPREVSRDNILSTAKSFAEARAWLAVLAVAVFSGLWPYVKMLWTQCTVSKVERGDLSWTQACERLRVIETLGKWSYADLNLVAINILIFDISTAEHRVLAAFKLKIDIFMQLHYGAFALTFAIIFSTLLTFWATRELSPACPSAATDETTPLTSQDNLAHVEKAGQESSKDIESVTEQREALLSGKLERVESWLAGFMLLGCLLLGSHLPFIIVTREGFLGNLIREDRTREMSLFSLPEQLVDLAVFRDQPLLRFWAGFFFVVNFVFPFLETLLLAASLFLSGCAEGASKWALRWADTAHSLGCIDVLLAAALITLLQLRTVVNYTVTDECKQFQDIYKGGPKLTALGLGHAADPDCFRPVCVLGSGFWVLLLYVLLRGHAYQLRSGTSLSRLLL